ncbi:MAG TPA: GAF domain-containing protein [Pyrinomonadaceae bacterium]|nr:GAF domain-containing protein [Pyrinomonadaceae bacterium]
MADHKPSEMLTEEMHVSSARTQQLPRLTEPCEDFQEGQSRILQMIAANKPLSETLSSLVKLIEAQSPGMLCSVLLLSDDGNHVLHGAAPSLSDDYVKAIDGAPIGPKEGSCGTAMYRGEPVIVVDILTDPLWENYRDLAAAAALRACWSTPILSSRGKVLGSFAMYYRSPRKPSGDESRLTEVATRIAGLAIERQAAREALARTQSELAEAETMSEAAASVLDQIEQPLTAIINNAENCLQMLSEGPGKTALRDGLQSIAGDGRRALEAIGRIRSQNPER